MDSPYLVSLAEEELGHEDQHQGGNGKRKVGKDGVNIKSGLSKMKYLGEIS